MNKYEAESTIQEVIEGSGFLNPPKHSGFWETESRALLARADDLIRAYAAGDIRRVQQIQRDMRVGLKHLDDMLVGAMQRRPLKYHCGDCGMTWRGTGAQAAWCAPYDDEIRPGLRHTEDLQITFDEMA